MQPARARRGRPTGYAVAIAAWRSCGFCTGTLARACTGHAAGRHAVAGRQRTRMNAMDDIVKQAMAKWPHVPACSGWLGLDERGRWYLRDEEAQACGAFDSGIPGAKGAEVRNEKLADFIARNYLAEPDGRWFFQNGPQRVYVELESTPWIWRLRWDGGRLQKIGRASGRGRGEISGGAGSLKKKKKIGEVRWSAAHEVRSRDIG